VPVQFTSRQIATGIVAMGLFAALAGSVSYNAWKSSRLEHIKAGMSESQVRAVLGEPDTKNAGPIFDCSGDCWTWKLLWREYISVCFDRERRVSCTTTYNVTF